MSKQNEGIDNPYQAPASELVDQFRGVGEWSEFTILRAKEFARCLYLGNCIAISTYFFATIALDVLLHMWDDRSLGVTSTNYLMFLLAIVTATACIELYSWLYVRFQRRMRTFLNFVQSRQKQLERPYNQPFAVSVLILLASLLILLHRELTMDLTDLALTSLIERKLALLALPITLPIVYFVIRNTHRRAKFLLERMLSSE